MSFKIRRKTKCGATVTIQGGKSGNGGFRILSIGKAKVGRDPIPLDFLPFEIMDAVYNKNISFDTEEECQNFAYSL